MKYFFNKYIRTYIPQLILCLIVLLMFFVANPVTRSADNAFRVYWGALAFSAMSINLLMASRLGFLESLFGGLDKMIRHHKNFGFLALIAVVTHYSSPPTSVNTCDVSCQTAIQAGSFAFYVVLGISVISVFRHVKVKNTDFQLPYKIWKLSHWVVLGAWCLAFYHLSFITKMPFHYLNLAQLFVFFGSICFVLYIIGDILRLKNTYKYKVTSIEKHKAGTIVIATPLKKKLKHRAGQFAFIMAKKSSLGEYHPFTIAAGNNDDNIQFCIKPAGDFTAKLRTELQIDDILKIEGPYGRFNAKRIKSTQHWVAAGIGITPFLAMARSIASDPEHKITLRYIVRTKDDAIGVDEFELISEKFTNFNFILHQTSVDGRWKPEPTDELGGLFFCGPKPMLEGLQKQGHKVHFEHFKFI